MPNYIDRQSPADKHGSTPEEIARADSAMLIRTKQIFYARSDGRIEAGVRCYYETFNREFIAGVTADHDEARRLAEELDARLRATS
jgi:hypothetical protein